MWTQGLGRAMGFTAKTLMHFKASTIRNSTSSGQNYHKSLIPASKMMYRIFISMNRRTDVALKHACMIA
jgi:hypothetical protein